MSTLTMPALDHIADELELTEAELLRQSLSSLLEQRLRQVKAEIFAITGKYEVASVSEMDAQYQRGDLSEIDSWHDYQKLDHLEFKRDRLLELLESLV